MLQIELVIKDEHDNTNVFAYITFLLSTSGHSFNYEYET